LRGFIASNDRTCAGKTRGRIKARSTSIGADLSGLSLIDAPDGPTEGVARRRDAGQQGDAMALMKGSQHTDVRLIALERGRRESGSVYCSFTNHLKELVAAFGAYDCFVGGAERGQHARVSRFGVLAPNSLDQRSILGHPFQKRDGLIVQRIDLGQVEQKGRKA
jgi:hypothetical protein